jgi:hypothetical protein
MVISRMTTDNHVAGLGMAERPVNSLIDDYPDADACPRRYVDMVGEARRGTETALPKRSRVDIGVDRDRQAQAIGQMPDHIRSRPTRFGRRAHPAE